MLPSPHDTVPGGVSPGGCLETPVEPFRREGKRMAVVLERNGWLSQDLINAAVSVVLQERMGYACWV